jgi:hypothetical protein
MLQAIGIQVSKETFGFRERPQPGPRRLELLQHHLGQHLLAAGLNIDRALCTRFMFLIVSAEALDVQSWLGRECIRSIVSREAILIPPHASTQKLHGPSCSRGICAIAARAPVGR